MSIRVVCPNGHELNVKDSFAGKTGLCPKCKAKVIVPQTQLSEDAIMGILGPSVSDPDGDDPAFPVARHGAMPMPGLARQGSPPKKSCEKCNEEILAGTHICPFCHTYVAKLADF